jgi:hypothetical protein
MTSRATFVLATDAKTCLKHSLNLRRTSILIFDLKQDAAHEYQTESNDRQGCLSHPRRVGLALPSLLLSLKSLGSYAAPIALRCWKHSRQNTGRPCVGRKGTVVSFPHCEQFVFVSERIGEA